MVHMICQMLLFYCVLPRVSAKPGDSSKNCFDANFTYERCCLEIDDDCWTSNETDYVCCTGLYESMHTQQPFIFPIPIADRVELHHNTSLPLVRCVQAYRRTTQRHLFNVMSTIESNNFIKAAGCVASLPEVDVIIDVFLGGGFTIKALLDGVTRGYLRHQLRSRPAEVLSMESNRSKIEFALASKKGLRGWEGCTEVLPAETHEDLVKFQQQMLTKGDSTKPKIWILEGKIDPFKDGKYNTNALDTFCQHRSPVDAVLIDSVVARVSDIWYVLEHVCKPHWLLLHNTNLPTGPGWLKHQLESLGGWRVVVKGHYSLDLKTWGRNDVRRIRSWSILQRLH